MPQTSAADDLEQDSDGVEHDRDDDLEQNGDEGGLEDGDEKGAH